MDPLLASMILGLLITSVIITVLWSFWGDNKNFPKWPSLILLLPGEFSLFFVVYDFMQILSCPKSPLSGTLYDDGSFIGLAIYIFSPIMTSFFLLSYLLRKASFRDFFKKESYRKNGKKIFLGLIAIIITWSLIFFGMFMLNPLGPLIKELCYS